MSSFHDAGAQDVNELVYTPLSHIFSVFRNESRLTAILIL
jgi:hypothetical protein